jgi:hypothetical protein
MDHRIIRFNKLFTIKGENMKKKISFVLLTALISTVATSAPQAIASQCSPSDPCGTWAMLDPQGTVTNIIVCQASVCGGGTWAGQTVVPQVAPNPVTNDTTGTGGYWGTYDSNTREFTVDRNGPNQTPAPTQTNSETRTATDPDGAVTSTTTIEATTPLVAKTFKYEDTVKDASEFDEKGQPINGWDQRYLKDKELPTNSPATVKVTKAYIEDELEKFKSESLTLAQRMTQGELTEVAKAENKTLIIENIMSVVRLLNTWMKIAKGEIK